MKSGRKRSWTERQVRLPDGPTPASRTVHFFRGLPWGGPRRAPKGQASVEPPSGVTPEIPRGPRGPRRPQLGQAGDAWEGYGHFCRLSRFRDSFRNPIDPEQTPLWRADCAMGQGPGLLSIRRIQREARRMRIVQRCRERR